jgi:superfamily II DNA or RNA helicase
MELEDFLPTYPDYSPDPLFSVYDDELTDVIQQKKEFQELSLEPAEARPENPGDLLTHQRFLQRFMSGHTPYDGILLWHAVGTGKTGSAIAIAEGVKHFNNSFRKALLLVRGTTFTKNFKNDLAYVMTKGEYLPVESSTRPLTVAERTRRMNKLIGAYYEINTFQIFAKLIENTPEDQLAKLYSNRVIIIDEVHNLRDKESGDVYNTIHRFLHAVRDCKIVLLTATPIKDRPHEFASIINLVLPLDKQLPIGESFMSEYFTDRSIPPEKQRLLIEQVKGRISYLQQARSDVIIREEGEFLPGIPFKLVMLRMSEIQRRVYRQAFQEDTKSDQKEEDDAEEAGRSGIYQKSRQASLCTTEELEVSTKKLVELIGKGTEEEKLTNLKKFSIKYHYIISHLLRHPTQNAFIYCKLVKRSGIKALTTLLRIFNFERASGSEQENNVPSRRYAEIHGETAEGEVERLIASFNRPENKKGEYIQVVIGSSVIGEGRSLMSVRDIFIATPHWNYTDTEQAIGRGIRFGSHRYLDEKTVTIHRLAATPPDRAESIDLKMYQTSAEKDYLAKQIEAVARTAAIDCQFNKKRNRQRALDGSRECLYQECEYECAVERKPGEITDTYNLFYTEKEYQELKLEVQKKFSIRFEYHLYELLSEPAIRRYSPIVSLRSLMSMISRHESFTNPLGFTSYLKEKNSVVFLVNDLTAAADPSYLYQTRVGQRFPVRGFGEYINRYPMEHLTEILKQIGEGDDMSKLAFRELDSDLRFELLKYCLYEKYAEGRSTALIEFITSEMAREYIIDEEVAVEMKRETLLIPEKKWVEKVQEEKDDVQEIYQRVKKFSNEQDLPEYAISFGKTFKISNFDAIPDLSSKGKVCTSYQTTELTQILDKLIRVTKKPLVNELGKPIPTPTRKEEICKQIVERFSTLNLLISEDLQSRLKTEFDARKEEKKKVKAG